MKNIKIQEIVVTYGASLAGWTLADYVGGDPLFDATAFGAAIIMTAFSLAFLRK